MCKIYKIIKKYCIICQKELIITRTREFLENKYCSKECRKLDPNKPPRKYKRKMSVEERAVAELLWKEKSNQKRLYAKVPCIKCGNLCGPNNKTKMCNNCANALKINTICKNCGKKLMLTPSLLKRRGGMCNSKCISEWKKKNGLISLKFNCAFCGKECYVRPSRVCCENPCCSVACRGKFKRNKRTSCSQYKTKIKRLLRICLESKELKIKILSRDSYKCIECGSKRFLHLHHIRKFSEIFNEFASINSEHINNTEKLYELAKDYPDFWDENNVCILCFDCHSKKHPEYNLSYRK